MKSNKQSLDEASLLGRYFEMYIGFDLLINP